jgi:hypothetical protein
LMGKNQPNTSSHPGDGHMFTSPVAYSQSMVNAWMRATRSSWLMSLQ